MSSSVYLNKQMEDTIIERLQRYFLDELDQPIGQLAAMNLLSFMMIELEPHVYNRAVQDARKVVQERFLQLDEEIDMLEKSTFSRSRER